ncbi:hypothetical protein DPMN_001591 [Dreissena polymorpha]|uniref:Uncharacterized protein n=1 Tax=Dreissena polymorpha TaxID=45954 RepID=A0A9D4MI20_DREPO|nr:hypothetical protein DPMN_001591 [Dreissena polymorpha]
MSPTKVVGDIKTTQQPIAEDILYEPASNTAMLSSPGSNPGIMEASKKIEIEERASVKHLAS